MGSGASKDLTQVSSASQDEVKAALGALPAADLKKIKEALAALDAKPAHGAAHGPWKDETYCASSSEIHAPRYFSGGWDDFGEALKAAPGELLLRDIMTKEMYDKFKDEKTELGVTLDKCIKGGIDKARIGEKWNVGKVGILFGDAECVTKFKELMHPIIVARHGNPTLPTLRQIWTAASFLTTPSSTRVSSSLHVCGLAAVSADSPSHRASAQTSARNWRPSP
ncbi:unnamed protein product [Polarella glacialis]|uniref:Phosphagen kinase N-terminal domain-containing protein n=1 Tax=Polarella glacialis TaxID=89957 RepID=A0A813JTV7_POLGL|nr:unnamed protein product [Polarella glacialis]